jgi:hypothetical protein
LRHWGLHESLTLKWLVFNNFNTAGEIGAAVLYRRHFWLQTVEFIELLS